MDEASPVGSTKEPLQMRYDGREYRRSRSGAVDKAGTEWAVVQWWMSSLLVSRGGGRGRCGRRSRSGEVDAAGSEWALVRRWMSSLGFREGRGERAMKYGRRDVRCSGAVELVVFAGGGEEMGVPCSGGNRKLPKQPRPIM